MTEHPSPARLADALMAVKRSYEIWIPALVATIAFAVAILVAPNPALVRDALAYTMSALRLLRDHFFAYDGAPPGTPLVPNAAITPGPVLWLALFYAFARSAGSDPVAAIMATQPAITLAQYLLGVGIVVLVALCGRELGGRKLALVSGIAAALYLPFAWAATTPLSEQLGTFLFTALIYGAILWARPNATRTLAGAVGLGVLVAAVTMMRPALGGWLALPALYLLIRRAETPKRFAIGTIAIAIAFSLVFAPWWVRNVRVTGTFTPLRSGVTVLTPVTPAGGPVALSASPPMPDYPADIVGYAGPQASGNTTQAAFVNSLTRSWIAPLAVAYEELWTPGVGRVGFGQWTTTSYPVFYALVNFTGAYQWVLLVAALASVLFVARSTRLLIVWSVPLYVLLVHASTQFSQRYFYPAMPAVVLLAACGAYGLWMLATRQPAETPSKTKPSLTARQRSG